MEEPTTESGDGIIERNIDFNCRSYQILDGLEFSKIVLALHVLTVYGKHPSNEAPKGRDAVSLADAKYRLKDGESAFSEGMGSSFEYRINVCSARFKGGERIRNCAAGIVVEMAFDFTMYHATESSPTSCKHVGC